MSSKALASAARNGEEQPLKRRKKPAIEPNPNLPLPGDLVVSCLARVSRLHYPTLSLVSKTFRSLLTSPELYQARNLLGCTENCLYVCLRFPLDPNPHWFSLYKKPNQTLTKKGKEKSSGNVLVPIQILNSSPVEWSHLITVGSNLYALSRAIEESPCSNIPFLDCRTHMWHEAPRMRIAHTDSEFDGQMYLPGCYENPHSLNCVEVFNTKTQSWNPVRPEKRVVKLGNMEGKIYVILNGRSVTKGLALKPKDLTGEPVGLDSNFNRVSICMIENITYCYKARRGIKWSHFESNVWKKLKGLEGLPNFSSYCNVKLVSYGGKLVVLWDKFVPVSGFRYNYKEKMIWCAEVSLEMHDGEEIWGKVEWFDEMLTVPKSYKFVCAIAATI